MEVNKMNCSTDTTVVGCQLLRDVSARCQLYVNDPLNNPHGLSNEERSKLEIIHRTLTQALMNLKNGEIDENLLRNVINETEHKQLKSAITDPYTCI